MIPKLLNEGEVPDRFSLSYYASQVKTTCDKMHLKTMHTLPPDISTGLVPPHFSGWWAQLFPLVGGEFRQDHSSCHTPPLQLPHLESLIVSVPSSFVQIIIIFKRVKPLLFVKSSRLAGSTLLVHQHTHDS